MTTCGALCFPETGLSQGRINFQKIIAMLQLRSIDEERMARMASLANRGAGAMDRFLKMAEALLPQAEMEELMKGVAFAKQVKYHHPGLSSNAYLAHPLRVTALAMQIEPSVCPDTLSLALLHNILEVSDVETDQLEELFNKKLSMYIQLLTVDRAKERSRAYKKMYYQKIYDYRATRIIKALDKLDNLFMLCLNRDDTARNEYLEEIQDYIFPIVQNDIPEIDRYIRNLVTNCKEIGCLDQEEHEAQ